MFLIFLRIVTATVLGEGDREEGVGRRREGGGREEVG